jgi:methylmalonyl-CoA mutase
MQENDLLLIKSLIGGFTKNHGRRPRLLVLAENQEEKSHKAALLYAELGFDVDVAPTFKHPKHLVKQALENDVHCILILVKTLNTSQLVGGIKEELRDKGLDSIRVDAVQHQELENNASMHLLKLIKFLNQESD